MELWIRSQNKTILSKAHDLVIREDRDENNETNYFIVDTYTLGIYKTKERALEVLDEIQRTIAKNQSLISLMHNFTDLKGNEEGVAQIFKDMIYEMPKE